MKIIRGNVSVNSYALKELPDLSDVKIEGSFYCHSNELTSLKGAPMEVSGLFFCAFNPGNFTEEDVKKVCKVHGKIYI